MYACTPPPPPLIIMTTTTTTTTTTMMMMIIIIVVRKLVLKRLREWAASHNQNGDITSATQCQSAIVRAIRRAYRVNARLLHCTGCAK